MYAENKVVVAPEMRPSTPADNPAPTPVRGPVKKKRWTFWEKYENPSALETFHPDGLRQLRLNLLEQPDDAAPEVPAPNAGVDAILVKFRESIGAAFDSSEECKEWRRLDKALPDVNAKLHKLTDRVLELEKQYTAAIGAGQREAKAIGDDLRKTRVEKMNAEEDLKLLTPIHAEKRCAALKKLNELFTSSRGAIFTDTAKQKTELLAALATKWKADLDNLAEIENVVQNLFGGGCLTAVTVESFLQTESVNQQ